MKLNTDYSEIERIGIKQESTFTIKTTAQAFDILSSGLYTDKVLAVVRELSCNAYDAQVAGGKGTEPFIIHLPNALEPYFSVKDNGIGLSDVQIQGESIPVTINTEDGPVHATDEDGQLMFNRVGGLYTTYFDSTKTDSNDFIGALGLGSKSPFSYSKSFEVISRFENKRRIYAIFINEDGIPTVALMSETDTDECNGLEVKMTIAANDFTIFRDKVQDALRFFETKPTIIGSDYFSWNSKDLDIILEGKGWKMVRCSWTTKGKPLAIQGNVPYKIDPELLKDILDDNEYQFLTETRILMDFNIGELKVAASREGLQYDKTTKQNIQARIKIVIADIQKHIRSAVKKHKDCYWNLVIELNELSNTIFGNTKTLHKIIDSNTIRSPALRKYAKDEGRIDVGALEFHTMASYSSKWGSTRPKRNETHRYVLPSKDKVIMINDLKVGGVQRMGKWFVTNNNKTIIAIKANVTAKGNPVEKKAARELKRILKHLGHPSVIKISELESTRLSTNKVSGEVMLYLGEEGDRYPYNVKWQRTSIDFSEGGLYYTLQNRKDIVESDGVAYHYSSTHFKSKNTAILALISQHQEHLGINIEELGTSIIYGANLQAKKMILENGNWFDVYDLLDKIAPLYEKLNIFSREWENTKNRMEFTKVASNVHFSDIYNDMTKNHPIKKMFRPIMKKLDKLVTAKQHINRLRDLRRLGSESDKLLIDNVTFREKYPMLRYIGRYDNLEYDEMQDVFKYIDIINKGDDNE